MRIDVITIFGEMFEAITKYGITSRALQNKLWELYTHNPRDFTYDNYKRIDDRPYGGGAGMVMKAQPLYESLMHIRQNKLGKNLCVLLTPEGKTFNHTIAKDLLNYDSLTFICGRYEGIDERFIEKYVDEKISIGDVVLSGGELPAMAIIDSIIRLIPTAINNQQSHEKDSFEQGLLDYPHFTTPRIWQDTEVPKVLLSGNHKKITEWQKKQSLEKTAKYRPDLLKGE